MMMRWTVVCGSLSSRPRVVASTSRGCPTAAAPRQRATRHDDRHRGRRRRGADAPGQRGEYLLRVQHGPVLRTNADENNALELQVRNATFVGVTLIAGTSTNLTPVARAVGQNYIQIVEDAGTVYMQQSSDHWTWVTLYMFPTPFAVDDVQVSLQAGIPSGGQGSDSVWYASFGGP
jgi:hypothetical protein